MGSVLRFFSKVWAWVQRIPAHIWFIGISLVAWLSYQKALRWKKRARIERERVEVEQAYSEALEHIQNKRQQERNVIFDKHRQQMEPIKAKERKLSNVASDQEKLTEHLNSVFGEDK